MAQTVILIVSGSFCLFLFYFIFSFSVTSFTCKDRVRKIYKKFPQKPVPQHLDLADDDDMQQLSEALAAAKVRVEACSSFLRAAIKYDTLSHPPSSLQGESYKDS